MMILGFAGIGFWRIAARARPRAGRGGRRLNLDPIELEKCRHRKSALADLRI